MNYRKETRAQQDMNPDRNLKYWVPVFIWMIFIYWMSTAAFSSENTSLIIEPILFFLMPSLNLEKAALFHGVIRKLAHVTEYFILGILLFRAFRSGSKEPLGWRWAFFSLLVGVLYAAGDEFHQSFVSSRTASLADVGIDALAGAIAQGVSILRQLCRRK